MKLPSPAGLTGRARWHVERILWLWSIRHRSTILGLSSIRELAHDSVQLCRHHLRRGT